MEAGHSMQKRPLHSRCHYKTQEFNPTNWQKAMDTLNQLSLSPNFSMTSVLTTHLVQPESNRANILPWVPDEATTNSSRMVMGVTC